MNIFLKIPKLYIKEASAFFSIFWQEYVNLRKTCLFDLSEKIIYVPNFDIRSHVTQKLYRKYNSYSTLVNLMILRFALIKTKLIYCGTNKACTCIPVLVFNLRYFNFEQSFKLRCCRARDLFGSQIP